MTTIAWRLGQSSSACWPCAKLLTSAACATDYSSFAYAGTAAVALAQLDDAYAAWLAGIRTLDETG